jgi:hypothetical protein
MRIYFSQHPSDPAQFIAVKHGDTGYHPTTIHTQDHANALNERQDITPAEVKAAVICSMFDCWRSFDALAADERTASNDTE